MNSQRRFAVPCQAVGLYPSVMLALSAILFSPTATRAADASSPIVGEDLVFLEQDGMAAVEAEHFFKQSKSDVRKWYLQHSESKLDVTPDGDPNHVAGASGGAYLEILPDTRRTHADKLIGGENFSNEPGKLAVLHYRVHFQNPGRYYVWVRAHSTGSEDNGIHVGLNGKWPESGQRMQWCEGKRQWWWESKQRTAEKHCGVPHQIYLDIPEAGTHEITFSLREDGFEFDKFFLTRDREMSRPLDAGPEPTVHQGVAAKAFKLVAAEAPVAAKERALTLEAAQFIRSSQGYYLDGSWLAIDPDKDKSASARTAFPFASGKYHVTLEAVGEEDGQATYQVSINDDPVGEFQCPLSDKQFEEGTNFHKTWSGVAVGSGDVIKVASQVASADGHEYSRARIARLRFKPADEATRLAVAKMQAPTPAPALRRDGPALVQPRGADGTGKVIVSGELKQWHKVTLTLDGPFAHENDKRPNPFTDYALEAIVTHESGKPSYRIPGHFAADGNAAESSAVSGTHWRVHFSPDLEGRWDYELKLLAGEDVALGQPGKELAKYAAKGSVEVGPTDKSGTDFRAHGRLQYVGGHYLRFAGTGKYFLKAGPDAPETLLAYADFDGTTAGKPDKVPLKTWAPHLGDWNEGDPTWKDGKGKGLIGALNYLSQKGCNVFSFLPYNAGGDGDNVWPFVERDDKFHYDCSKLDQWGIVFDYATVKGLYLHFKLQENEIDDNRRGHEMTAGTVPESLDGGKLGPERKLYCRELISRFGHALALNWNIGEENTQSPQEQRDMIRFLNETDPYQHNVVIHTFPDQQDKVYTKLLGDQSLLTGASLQNSWSAAHKRTLQWRNASAEAGRPWVVANDEQGPASHGVPNDPGYEGHNGIAVENKREYDLHDVRKQTLWGTLMAGGAGVEYYFGYKLPQNDLICEDFRSRDRSWDYCRIALDFFRDNEVPFWEMECHDDWVTGKGNFCFALKDAYYLVYLPNGGETELTVSEAQQYDVQWFNPRDGGALKPGEAKKTSDSSMTVKAPDNQDWLAVIKRR